VAASLVAAFEPYLEQRENEFAVAEAEAAAIEARADASEATDVTGGTLTADNTAKGAPARQLPAPIPVVRILRAWVESLPEVGARRKMLPWKYSIINVRCNCQWVPGSPATATGASPLGATSGGSGTPSATAGSRDGALRRLVVVLASPLVVGLGRGELLARLSSIDGNENGAGIGKPIGTRMSTS
jgi:hypothetical protein